MMSASLGPLSPAEFEQARNGPYGEIERIAREKGIYLGPKHDSEKKLFTVTVTFIGTQELEIEAADAAEARKLARKDADRGKVNEWDWDIDEVEVLEKT